MPADPATARNAADTAAAPHVDGTAVLTFVLPPDSTPPTLLDLCAAAATAAVTLTNMAVDEQRQWTPALQRWAANGYPVVVHAAPPADTPACDLTITVGTATVAAYVPPNGPAGQPRAGGGAELTPLIDSIGLPAADGPGVITVTFDPACVTGAVAAVQAAVQAAQLAYTALAANPDSADLCAASNARWRVRVRVADPDSWPAATAAACVRNRDGAVTALARWAPADRTLSDGTLRCAVRTEAGVPCQKRIPAGWHGYEGHAGGHSYADDETWNRLHAWHYDAGSLLAGQPTAAHAPQDCPDPDDCCRMSRDRAV